MQWTPEHVKAEMDYRRQLARHGVALEHLRTAREARPSWWRRLRVQHG